MNILITGGAGFLGSNLAEALLAQGHLVTVVDNLLTGSIDNIADLEDNPNFLFYELGVETDDFRDCFMHSSAEQFDRIYHLACPTGVPNIQILGEEMIDACSTGTKNVLLVARKHAAKMIFTSSSEVYGDPSVTPQSEEYTGNVDPQGWRASYEEGKRFSESLIQLFVSKYKVDARTVRLFNVYGPRMNLSDQRVIPRFVTQALVGQPLTVHDDGLQERTMCYVSDLIHGLQLVLAHGKAGEIFNLGSDQSISMLNLAEKVRELTLTESVIHFTKGMPQDHKSRMPVLEKVHSLGWRQTIGLDEGIKLTIADFKKRLGLDVPVIETPMTVHETEMTA